MEILGMGIIWKMVDDGSVSPGALSRIGVNRYYAANIHISELVVRGLSRDSLKYEPYYKLKQQKTTRA